MTFNLTIVIALMALIFVAGFFVGGKWKAQTMRNIITLETSAKRQLAAIREHLHL